MQINIRIGAGAVLVAALLATAARYASHRGWIGTHPLQALTGHSPKEPEFIPTNGGFLTIAWVKGYETFEKRSLVNLDIGPAKVPLPLGETVSEISTAAKYQYQIALEKRWPIQCTTAQCVVRTGPVELARPVAIYHEETTRKTASGWARFDKAENLEALNKALDAGLVERGNQPRNRDLGLKNGRLEIEKFVRAWMVKDSIRDRKIIVLYPGEQLVDGKPKAGGD